MTKTQSKRKGSVVAIRSSHKTRIIEISKTKKTAPITSDCVKTIMLASRKSSKYVKLLKNILLHLLEKV